MLRFILLFLAFNPLFSAFAQNNLTVDVKDSNTLSPLQGVRVELVLVVAGGIAGNKDSVNQTHSSGLKSVTDANGISIFSGIQTGKYLLKVTHSGYQPVADSISIPLSGNGPYSVLLLAEEEEEELEEVIISATRSSRTIDDIPTRVEAISGEELDEKGNMKPGDIRMLLNESTGIQTQQTSASSGNSSIRIQGLDGRYTQIIRDGFPVYSGFSGGLGLLQIAPLDLKQVEVIKGSASTLYGGGAIAGLVNLVSKTPGDEPELSFLLNGTSALGLDASAYYASKKSKIGTAVYAAYNHGTPYDPADIGITAIPEFDRFTVNPRVFIDLGPRTRLQVGLNATLEKRTGGDIALLKDEQSNNGGYFEENETSRYSTQASLTQKAGDNGLFTLKNSLSNYDRKISIPGYVFSGDQFATFSEATYQFKKDNLEWVGGISVSSDRFDEDQRASIAPRSYSHLTTGAFLQNTWNASDQFALESGLRGDYHNQFGFFALPRIAALFKEGSFSARIGGGLGYKTPTVFTEDAERIQFRNVLPIDQEAASAERSYGANADVNYRTVLFDETVSLSVNQLIFYTRIKDPLVLNAAAGGLYRFDQLNGSLNTRGMETNIKLTYQDFKLFIGYTLADVRESTDGIQRPYPLVARHRLNNVLMYEQEDKWKIGLEGYYFSSQRLTDGSKGRSYWIAGFMTERIFSNFSLFLNFENFLDTRQTRFDTIYTGSLSDPTFRDIYAPVDGFVVNGGIKVRL